MWNLKKRKKKTTCRIRVHWWLPGGRVGGMGSGERLVRVQAFSYNMSKFWGSTVQHGDYN